MKLMSALVNLLLTLVGDKGTNFLGKSHCKYPLHSSYFLSGVNGCSLLQLLIFHSKRSTRSSIQKALNTTVESQALEIDF